MTFRCSRCGTIVALGSGEEGSWAHATDRALARYAADRGVHRTPFTGLKPAGLDVGPVIPVAEKAIEGGDAVPLEGLLVSTVREEMARRFEHLGHLRGGAHRNVDGARAYVQAMLDLEVWAHALYQATRGTGHAPAHAHD
jgi:hypothetical protein